jgi:hypothetical protein
MNPRTALLSLSTLLGLALARPALAVDPSFKLLKEEEKVNVYSPAGKGCEESGADVLFVVENKTKERLELKMELLNMKIKNKLTVVVEPASNTSVLSMSPDAAMCGVELIGMKVNSLTKTESPEPAKAPATAAVGAEPKI